MGSPGSRKGGITGNCQKFAVQNTEVGEEEVKEQSMKRWGWDDKQETCKKLGEFPESNVV